MSNREQLNELLDQMPPAEAEKAAAALIAELDALAWDRQIEEDYKAGRLDDLINEARADIAAGRTTPL